MVRTPDEIKKGLECCGRDECTGCPYDHICEVHYVTCAKDALAYIQRLERERDVAVADMTELMKGSESCAFCKYYVEDEDYCAKPPNSIFTNGMCWEWRGVQEVE